MRCRTSTRVIEELYKGLTRRRQIGVAFVHECASRYSMNRLPRGVILRLTKLCEVATADESCLLTAAYSPSADFPTPPGPTTSGHFSATYGLYGAFTLFSAISRPLYPLGWPGGVSLRFY